MAFEECYALRDFQLNEGIQELGSLCLWKTAVADLKFPPHIKMTPEQLGTRQDSNALCLPEGLETVDEKEFY